LRTQIDEKEIPDGTGDINRVHQNYAIGTASINIIMVYRRGM
jgi:hypothetical protein